MTNLKELLDERAIPVHRTKERTVRSLLKVNFVFQMMSFVFQMMSFVFQMMSFV